MKKCFSLGPWKKQPCHEGLEIYKDGLAIARIPSNIQIRETATANAVLIQTAPELVEALENLLGFFDTPIAKRKYGNNEFYNEAISFARTTLEKACNNKTTE